MSGKRKSITEILSKLESLGLPVPFSADVFHYRGDTFHIVITAPEWVDNAVKVIRRNGYYVTEIRTTGSAVSVVVINLYGTEWQDGLIPENLAAIPLREDDDKQLPLL